MIARTQAKSSDFTKRFVHTNESFFHSDATILVHSKVRIFVLCFVHPASGRQNKPTTSLNSADPNDRSLKCSMKPLPAERIP